MKTYYGIQFRKHDQDYWRIDHRGGKPDIYNGLDVADISCRDRRTQIPNFQFRVIKVHVISGVPV